MISHDPRHIIGFNVAFDKSLEHIQNIVDNVVEAKYYCTDGYNGYIDIVYPGKHIQNIHDKSDTFNVEVINGDLRHHISILARRSRYFPRSLETLKTVVEVFVDVYNKFGLAKFKFQQKRKNGEFPSSFINLL